MPRIRGAIALQRRSVNAHRPQLLRDAPRDVLKILVAHGAGQQHGTSVPRTAEKLCSFNKSADAVFVVGAVQEHVRTDLLHARGPAGAPHRLDKSFLIFQQSTVSRNDFPVSRQIFPVSVFPVSQQTAGASRQTVRLLPECRKEAQDLPCLQSCRSILPLIRHLQEREPIPRVRGARHRIWHRIRSIGCAAKLLRCLPYDPGRGFIVRIEDHRDAALYDACLLGGDLFRGVSQVLHVVKADAGDDCQHRGAGIGGVQTSAQSCLQNDHIHPCILKDAHGHVVKILKVGRPGRAVVFGSSGSSGIRLRNSCCGIHAGNSCCSVRCRCFWRNAHSLRQRLDLFAGGLEARAVHRHIVQQDPLLHVHKMR